MNKPELLSPAGNLECLKAAVDCGADAVYVGLKNYSARSFANNFTGSELKEGIAYAHLYDAKVYVAVNTLLDNRELAELEKELVFLNDIGADAIIVQDLGVFYVASKVVPELPVHASTQMTVHNLDGALMLQNMGFSRVVLARELSFDEIKYISENLNIETEIFVHGAHCISYSGQCLMSSFLGGRSGNRGKCAQPCRLLYSYGGYKNKSLLSMKDMSYIENISLLKNSKAASLKIEGRMKGVSYVSSVVSMYRKYLDSSLPPNNSDLNSLYSVFNRGGYTDGYLIGSVGRDMFCYNKPDNPYKDSVAEINPSAPRISADLYYEIKKDAFPYLEISSKGKSASVCLDVAVSAAQNAPLTDAKVENQLKKLNDTPFAAENIRGILDNGAFLPSSALNELRRRTVLKLTEELTKPPVRKKGEMPELNCKEDAGKFSGYTVKVSNKEQLSAIYGYSFEKILVPVNLLSYINGYGNVYVVLPRIIKDSEISTYINEINKYKSRISGIYIGNIGHISAFGRIGLPLCGDFGLNVFNSYAAEVMIEQKLSSVTLSAEISIQKAADIKTSVPKEIIAYGKIPLMITENCLIHNMEGKNCCFFEKTPVHYMEDRKNAMLPVMKSGLFCRNELYNSVPIYMADKLSDLYKTNVGYFRLSFTDENAKTVKEVVNAYLNKREYEPEKFTRGYFYKNIE